MNKNDKNEWMVVALRVVGYELKKEYRKKRKREYKRLDKQVSPLEVRSANSFGLSGGRGFHDRTGWQLIAD